jgi:hypothetical protein
VKNASKDSRRFEGARFVISTTNEDEAMRILLNGKSLRDEIMNRKFVMD